MYSIFHFFKTLVKNRNLFADIKKLEDFPFDNKLLSCRNKGQFPDMAVRISPQNDLFTGGELIELKDSDSYTVSSFNSTIPTGKKEISKVVKGENSIIRKQMEEAGDIVNSMPLRDVYYLIRGKKKESVKVLLIHGNFFETIHTEDLISQSFSQVLEERLQESGLKVNNEIKTLLVNLFSEQENFSKVRNVNRASVKLRFRIMTEVKAEGNILNSKKYPEIPDDTLNFVIPYHTEDDKAIAIKRMLSVFGKRESEKFRVFPVKHHFNGYFLVFQLNLIR
ncbi:MAG: hypothetical protein BWK80_58630 [Desulfobacteraceae bacterium IS3]|nr:MAG: hypothetical protein BWK80_58630 [Desulfobacteraceae bacterium IS3]